MLEECVMSEESQQSQQSQQNQQGQKPTTGWFVFRWVAAFFGVMIVANVIFLMNALGTWPGEDTEAAYDKGIDYNAIIVASEKARALGWQMSVQSSNDSAGFELLFTALDKGKKPLRGLEVIGKLVRPVTRDFDISLAFDEVGEGVYRATHETLALGQWELRILAKNDVDENRYSERLYLK